MNQGPEFEAVTDRETGMFFEYNDVMSLAEKIEEWFEVTNDKSREEISNNCYEVIDDKYNPYKQIELLTSILNI